jgi:hypothetical protein
MFPICKFSGIPQLILMTKVDKLCDYVQKDVSKVFYSSNVEQAVDKASQLLGLRRANVLPVKNYENEAELDDNVDILSLLALRKMLHCSEDFMLNMKHREKNVQVEMGKLKLEK